MPQIYIMTWTTPAIFNPNGSDTKQNRKIWKGNPTNLIQLNDVKFNWAISLYEQMRGNFWIPEKLDLTSDISDYKMLTESERRAYNGILAYLVFLDSIQTVNIPNLGLNVTAAEVRICLTEQTSQETMHNKSYQNIIESIIQEKERNHIYELWREDDILRNRCEYIASKYQDYQDNPTEENYFKALVADYILESLYFYNGFIFFYTLSSRGLMPGTSDTIVLINRDELSHVRLYQKLLQEALNGGLDLPDNWQEYITESFNTAIEHECRWSDHIIGDNILGISSTSTRQYTNFIADLRLRSIGLPGLEGKQINPYKHLDDIADIGSDGMTKNNFFEKAVTGYQMATAVEGWDEI